MKLSRVTLRRLIAEELESMGEDVIVPKSVAMSKSTPPLSRSKVCEQCGAKMYEDSCMECGYSSLQEGGCGCDTTPMPQFNPGNMSAHERHNNEYMAKPALYKVAKYASKMLQMIPDGYELDDWQRTKIAQISDDISEVYHSLDYDNHKGDL